MKKKKKRMKWFIQIYIYIYIYISIFYSIFFIIAKAEKKWIITIKVRRWKPLTINIKTSKPNVSVSFHKSKNKSIRCFHSLRHKRPKQKPFLADLLCNRVRTCPLRFLPPSQFRDTREWSLHRLKILLISVWNKPIQKERGR